MVKKAGKRTRAKATAKARKKRAAEIFAEEERILRQAAIYCLFTFPTLWTVGGIREESGTDGSRNAGGDPAAHARQQVPQPDPGYPPQ